MRSLLLLVVFGAVLGAMLISPYIGLLSWAWFSFMHPQRETFGFTSTFSFDWYVAVLTMLAWLVSNERKVIPIKLTTVLLVVFGMWICVTTYFAIDTTQSYEFWQRTEKSLILALFVIIMTTTRARAQALVWVLVMSLGYYAVKGTGWVLGGGGHAQGPEGSMISDNNSFGVALVTTLPLLIYLVRSSANKLIAAGTLFVGGAYVLTVIGTFSRGAFIGLVALGGLLLLRSRAKLWPLVLGVVAVVTIVEVAPPSWYDRMATIFDTDQDQSVQSRFGAWQVSWSVALDRPILGGGFQFGERQAVWDRYTKVPGPYHAAHNSLFEVLGEHGFVGLGIYILLIISALQNTRVASRIGRTVAGAESVVELSNALQLTVLSSVIGGISLSVAYYDGYLVVYALTLAVRKIVEDAAVRESASREPVAQLPNFQHASFARRRRSLD